MKQTQNGSSPAPGTSDLKAVPFYNARGGFYDEMLGPGGQIRPHWQRFAGHIARIGREEMLRREAHLGRIIRENGVTYNVYSQSEAESRPWMLDPVPLVMAPTEWEAIEAAMFQRAELLQMLLDDLYGPQSSLQSGLLPADLVLGNPRFLYPLHGWEQRPKTTLNLYAADLCRSPDGQWWVQADRLDTPAGLGYALENRSLVARFFPTLFRDLNVRRLQSFVAAYCTAIEEQSVRDADPPRIVLLSPGPGHMTFYEHSFLARNLGFHLVEGADLMVREGRLLLKTVKGAQPVDVLVRFVDSSNCDPLEFDYQSPSGVAGLVNVLRKGALGVSNFPGAGVLETHALPAYLAGLSRHFLGEDLKIPSVAAWWCGTDTERAYVHKHLDKLVLRYTYHGPRTLVNLGHSLNATGLERWRRRIEDMPGQYCAQETVARGTLPCLEDGRLSARHFVLRVFLAQYNGRWTMMPGGLARVSENPDLSSFILDEGGETKDVWVVSPEEAESSIPPVLSAPERVQIRRGDFDMPSRVADNFFWLGRYVERTEGLARVLLTIQSGLRHEDDVDEYPAAFPFFRYFVDENEAPEVWGNANGRVDDGAEACLSRQIRDLRNPGSLVGNFQSLMRTASHVKERLSVQIWQQLQFIKEISGVATTRRPVLEEETARLLDDCIDVLAGFHGLAAENMTRRQAWHFLQLGKRIERTLVMSRLLSCGLGESSPVQDELLRKLLVCADSSMTYRRRYLTHLHPKTVLDLLLLDPANPRSVAFQISEIWALLKELPHHRSSSVSSAIDRSGLRVFSRVGLAEVEQLVKRDDADKRTVLKAFLDALDREVVELSNNLARRYFAHTLLSETIRPQRRIL